jgi:hypothetical protein
VFVTVLSHFDRLLKAMVSRPKPSAKRANDNQTSDKVKRETEDWGARDDNHCRSHPPDLDNGTGPSR